MSNEIDTMQSVTLVSDKPAVRSNASAANPSVRYVAYVIGLLTLVNVFNYVDRMALSVLMPSIKADLQLSDGQLGLLVGFAFSIFYAVCGIPIARWADRGVRRNIIALALATWSVMTALSGAAQNFWHLFAARVGVGAGEAGGLPPAQSLLYDYVPPKRRSSVFALHGFGLYIGMMLAMSMAGWLGELIGWRWTFVVLGAPGIILAVLVRLTLREPIRGRLDAGAVSTVPLHFSGAIRVLWNRKTYRLVVLFGVVNGLVQYGLLQWWPSFFTRVFGLPMAWVGGTLALAIGVSSAAGLLGGGLLADRAARRDARGPLKLGIVSVSLALPVLVAALFVPSAGVSMGLVALGNFFLCTANAPIPPIVLGAVAPSMRATGVAVQTFLVSAVGFGFGPFCVGVLSDYLTASFAGQALRYAMLAPISCVPLMAILLYAAARQISNDSNVSQAAVQRSTPKER